MSLWCAQEQNAASTQGVAMVTSFSQICASRWQEAVEGAGNSMLRSKKVRDCQEAQQACAWQ